MKYLILLLLAGTVFSCSENNANNEVNVGDGGANNDVLTELKTVTDIQDPPCNIDQTSIQRIPNPTIMTLNGHARAQHDNDTLISVFAPFYWRIGVNEMDTMLIYIQTPVGFQFDSVMTSVIPKGPASNPNCNNKLMVFDFKFSMNSQNQDLSTTVFKRLVSKSEWEDHDYYMVSINGRKKKVVAVNPDVQPDK